MVLNKREVKQTNRVKPRRRKQRDLAPETSGGPDLASAPLLNKRSLPAGAGIQPALTRQLLSMQASHGNQYVQHTVSEANGDAAKLESRSVTQESEDSRAPDKQLYEEQLRIQNPQEKAPATQISRFGPFMLPGMAIAAALQAQKAERERMRKTLGDVGGKLIEVREQLKKLEEEDALKDSDDLIDEAWVWFDDLNEEGPIPEHFKHFKPFVKEMEVAHDRGLTRIAARTASSLAAITDAEAPDVSGVLPDLQEAAHFAFIEGSEDQLQIMVDAVEKVMEHQKEVAKVLNWAKNAAKLAKAADTVAELEKAIGKVKGAGGVLQKIGKVAHSAHAIATISGRDNKAVASYEDEINKFEAAIEVIDATGAIDAVPLLGSLWSNYYVPVAKQSLKFLRVIGRHRNVEGRTWGFIRFQETGKLPKGTRKYFPGGEPVLRFMLGIMRNEEPTPSASVKKFFLERQDLFNVPFEGSTNQLESEGGGLFGGDEKLKNLMPWVRHNKHLVWAMLYGSFEI